MFVVHGTGKFRDRVSGPAATGDTASTVLLGDWYATVLFWRPHVALLVNERTLLPVLLPLAPAADLLERFPAALADILEAHGAPPWFVEHEVWHAGEYAIARTRNRSVVGMMNEFAFLAEAWADVGDLRALSLRLAHTPCGPLRSSHGFPDRELAALVEAASS
jgi:hypothetical protein